VDLAESDHCTNIITERLKRLIQMIILVQPCCKKKTRGHQSKNKTKFSAPEIPFNRLVYNVSLQ
jgi:hypothetical protein